MFARILAWSMLVLPASSTIAADQVTPNDNTIEDASRITLFGEVRRPHGDCTVLYTIRPFLKLFLSGADEIPSNTWVEVSGSVTECETACDEVVGCMYASSIRLGEPIDLGCARVEWREELCYLIYDDQAGPIDLGYETGPLGEGEEVNVNARLTFDHVAVCDFTGGTINILAYDVSLSACETNPTHDTTWGEIKERYR